MLGAVTIQSQINGLVGYLVEVGLASDQNLAFIRRSGGKQSEVTFPQAEQATVSLKDISYSEIYDHLLQERAFTAKLPDGALLLMRYLFVKDRLSRHSLAFFPSPHLEEFHNNPEIYLEDQLYAEVIARNIVPFPVRFDFDSRTAVHKPVVHPMSHLALGQYENCRIPVTAPLTPYWFVAFVLRNFYHTAFTCYAQDLPLFDNDFEETIDPTERSVIHVQVPLRRG